MSDPFSGIPDPGTPRPPRRRFQPGLVQEALQALQETLRPALPAAQRATRRAQQVANDALRRARRQGEDLWRRGRRNPRTVGVTAGAIALTLAGTYALSASGTGRSLCPPTSEGKTPKFLVLMDSVPQVAAGSKVEIHYDVCGLASGSAYRGRVRLAKQQAGKKKSARPKPLVVSFKDQADGVATRRQQELNLASAKPGTYTLELVVADSKGRERKRVQKVLIKAVGR
ncbi:MAG TPA: hypothetical protein VFO71_03790 [Gemmatimonadales bacterium]|nr:hypothetical protein [Gemmatimonadales bacterium]